MLHLIIREAQQLQQARRRPRVARRLRDLQDPFNCSDTELLQRYRFPRHELQQLTEIFEESLSYATNRNRPIPPALQVCVALNYFATGCLYSNLSASHSISQSSVCRTVHKVAATIIDKLQAEISFSDDLVIEAMAKQFLDVANFPNVLGCVDGTHIALKCPLLDEHVYVNRKGFHSINVQAICNADKKFCDMNLQFPGSSNDSFVFSQSGIYQRLTNGELEINGC